MMSLRLSGLEIIIVLISICLIKADFDYCRVHCPGRVEHTMCLNKPGGGSKCKNNAKVYLSTPEKREILELHCTLRNKVASGEETRGVGGVGQLSAGNMMKLVWNSEIGQFAKRWADQCEGGLHDECRKSGDGTMVGQNSYIGTADASQTSGDKLGRIKQIIRGWYDEVDNMNATDAFSFPQDKIEMIGNYTQLVWGETSYIGCGYTEFSLGDGTVRFRFVCNYKQWGNIPEGPVYRAGDKPCSTCPLHSVCSETYHALCWKENEFNDWNDNFGLYSAVTSWTLVLLLVIFSLMNVSSGTVF